LFFGLTLSFFRAAENDLANGNLAIGPGTRIFGKFLYNDPASYRIVNLAVLCLNESIPCCKAGRDRKAFISDPAALFSSYQFWADRTLGEAM